ncbi:tumor necrosis factor ligand superfamily member 13B isoform X1 [Nelusetta ayraudi]|uniref:tumor necrosis factor ligand superfamily member 13B isoform X1 n=1 Tax=Nelusetta ayraudi TaxID=303726 RepID=UPI003F7177DF
MGEAGVQRGTGEGRLSWPVVLLTLTAIVSSSISALSLHQLLSLRAEVDAIKSEVWRRREEGQAANRGNQTNNMAKGRELLHYPQHAPLRRKRLAPGAEAVVLQPCLQLLANVSRKTFRKELISGPHTGIPWQSGPRRGSALEADGDSILVREEGFYYVYSQVYYIDRTFAMGHVVIRRKRTVVGDESQEVVLFRCIQRMTPEYPYNTCYTGGIVHLMVGDHLELLIPRPTANVSLDEDSTFLGAIKLA